MASYEVDIIRKALTILHDKYNISFAGKCFCDGEWYSPEELLEKLSITDLELIEAETAHKKDWVSIVKQLGI